MNAQETTDRLNALEGLLRTLATLDLKTKEQLTLAVTLAILKIV
jgi:hypothetical protein